MPTITVRVSEGMKAEVEALGDPKYTGWWPDQAHFIREALNEHIKKFWKGERFCTNPQLEKQSQSKGEK